jgi:hypothetical protein
MTDGVDEPTCCATIGRSELVCSSNYTPEALTKMRRLLEECNLHPECQQSESICTPKRLIDVQVPGAPRLVENVQGVPYVALSYCWGEESNSWLVTTKANLESHKIAIPFLALPATLANAVWFTLGLGIQYIWIDSLCIVQDDALDWLNESKWMCHVYYNAYVVFAANIDTTCTSPMGAEQIFGNPIVQAEINLANSTRAFRRDSPLALHTGKLAGLKLPQSVRGWTFQESLMARRVLNFTQFEILWTCHRQQRCECFGASSLIARGAWDGDWNLAKCYYFGIDTGEPWPDAHRRYNLWQSQFIVDYMQRSLTRRSDRLVAISGIAQVFSKSLKRVNGLEEMYCAGIWEGDVVRNLLWCPTLARESGGTSE